MSQDDLSHASDHDGSTTVTTPSDNQQPAVMVVPKFFIKQRITVMVNRYE
ncbi:MAG: hypothetical protein JWR82_2464, partial [Blastococcus sp.]|nr:hypothetical protein [Blastococcus sp.]